MTTTERPRKLNSRQADQARERLAMLEAARGRVALRALRPVRRGPWLGGLGGRIHPNQTRLESEAAP